MKTDEPNITEHHDNYPQFQNNFKDDVSKLHACLDASFNPFSDSAPQILMYINNARPMPNNTQLAQSLRTLLEIDLRSSMKLLFGTDS